MAVNTAMQRLQEHPDDEPLFDAVTSLYLVVLQSIETMLKWLLDKSTCDPISSKASTLALLTVPREQDRQSTKAAMV